MNKKVNKKKKIEKEQKEMNDIVGGNMIWSLDKIESLQNE